MINFLLTMLHKIAHALEAASQRELQKAEAAFKDAGDLVAKATKHRKTAKSASQVAAAMKDTLTPAATATAAPSTTSTPQ